MPKELRTHSNYFVNLHRGSFPHLIFYHSSPYLSYTNSSRYLEKGVEPVQSNKKKVILKELWRIAPTVIILSSSVPRRIGENVNLPHKYREYLFYKVFFLDKDERNKCRSQNERLQWSYRGMSSGRTYKEDKLPAFLAKSDAQHQIIWLRPKGSNLLFKVEDPLFFTGVSSPTEGRFEKCRSSV